MNESMAICMTSWKNGFQLQHYLYRYSQLYCVSLHTVNLMMPMCFIRLKWGKVSSLICEISHSLIEIGKFDSYSLPWNQTTAFGYFGEMFFVTFNLELFWAVGGQVLLLFIFLCENNFVFAAMFVDFITEFDRMKDMPTKYDLIRKLIGFHNDIKRC